MKKLLPVRVVRGLCKLPRELVVPIPVHPQGQAWGAVSTDGAVGVPVHCRQWDQMAFGGTFQLKQFYGG